MKLISFPNLGNTCYINSVLQCFINDIYFRNNIIKNTFNNSKPEYEIIKKIIELINLKDDDTYSFIKFNLNEFNQLLFKNSYFTKFEQHDAHEFLLKFIDIFENESKEIYYGQTKLFIKCTKCNTTKEVFEDFTTLNLNIFLTEKKLHLYELFESYLKREIHNDVNNLYYCDTCKCNTTSEQKTVLWKLPKRLIVVFKRYSDNGDKNNNKINYPIDNVLVKESNTGNVFNYSLNNIIYHFGNINNGHYVNSTKINKKWYVIDDDNVTENSEFIINNANSYILFYSVH